MNKVNMFVFMFGIISYSCNLSALSIDKSNVPDEFKSFLQEEERLIDIEYPGGVRDKLKVITSFDTIRIDKSDKRLKTKLYQQLLEQNVKQDAAKNIIRQISSKEGLTTSTSCKGFLDKCIVLTDSYDIVFDYDNNKLRFFFSKAILNHKEKIAKYASGENSSPALINKSSLFVNSIGSDVNITLNDSLLQGLKYGYIESKFNVESNEGGIDVQLLDYNLDVADKKYKMGYFSYENNMNSTDFIGSFTNSDVLELSLGSSNDLLLNDSSVNKKIEIYVPAPGLLSIKKNGTYIKQYNVKSGQQDILYSSLPKGIYDIDVSIKSGTNIVFEKTFKIYNTNGQQLSKNELDYRFQIGLLKDNDYYNYNNNNIEEIESNNYKDKLYGTGKITYGINDNIMFGGGLTFAEDSNEVYQLGLSYLFSEHASLTASSKLYNKGSYLFDIDIYSSILNIGLSKFELKEDDSFAVYTEDSVSNMSLNVSRIFNLGLNLSAGMYYTYSKYDESKSSDLTGNLSYSIDSNSKVDFQANYRNDDNDSNSFDFNFSYIYNFDSGSSLRAAYGYDDLGNNNVSEEFTTQDLMTSDDYYLTLTGRTELNSHYEGTSALDILANYNDEHFTTGYYASVDSHGENNQTLTISSTQVLSESGLSFSNSHSDSYLKLKVNKSDDIKDSDTYGSLSINKNGRINRNMKINGRDELISLESYSEYKNEVDTSSSLIENTGSKEQSFFSMPGTVKTLDLDLTKIVSFVGSYSDIYDNGIANLSCEGDGCFDIEKIDGNVFKVAVRSGKEFILKDDSGSYTCLTPQVRNIEILNIGKSYCIPEMNQNTDEIIVYKDPNTNNLQNLVYLGVFNDENKWKYEKLVNDNDYKIIEKAFGNGLNLVYVELSSNDPIYIANLISNKLNAIMLMADIPRNDLSKYVLQLDDNWS